MVTLVVLSILAAIAIPAYAHYVLRGKLTEAPNTLSSMRISMEQYYQDNKSYAVAGGSTCGAANPTGSNFTYSCTTSNSGANYLLTATGTGQASGYSYTLTDANVEATTTVGAGARCAISGSTWNTNC